MGVDKENIGKLIFPKIRLQHFENEALPKVVTAELRHPVVQELDDIIETTQMALQKSQRFSKLAKGSSVAITCGSRGIKSKPLVIATAVKWLKERGFEPFIVPAMGSHGGARAEPQTALLAELGYTADTMGCPIRSSMDVDRIGTTSRGVPVWFDRNANTADAVLVVNRIKSHTSFDREIESGLTKMIAIGLGKAEGARLIHRLGALGYLEVLPEWANIAIDAAPIAYAIGIVENSNKRPIVIEGIEPENILSADARLLPVAKSNTPKLPFDKIDVLIVENIGDCSIYWSASVSYPDTNSYVIATNEQHSVKEFIETAFKCVDIDIEWRGEGLDEAGYHSQTNQLLIKIDKKYFRPTEVDNLLGDYSKAQRQLGWRPRTTFKDLVRKMVEHDCKQTK